MPLTLGGASAKHDELPKSSAFIGAQCIAKQKGPRTSEVQLRPVAGRAFCPRKIF